jgi:hypothetical protein
MATEKNEATFRKKYFFRQKMMKNKDKMMGQTERYPQLSKAIGVCDVSRINVADSNTSSSNTYLGSLGLSTVNIDNHME